MHSVPLTKVASHKTPLPLYIESIEGGIYLAMTEMDDERLPLSDSDGKPVRGQSVSALQSLLGGYNWSSISLLQRAAYDEMVGGTPEEGKVFEIPLSWSDNG